MQKHFKSMTKKITKESLEQYLHRIGWKLRDCGFKNYLLINQDDKPTLIQYRENYITIQVQGVTTYIDLNECNLFQYRYYRALCIKPKNKNNIFININSVY